jgi:short-subunit dehydrogenase
MWRASPAFWQGKRVWVIGATSGIGRGIAESIEAAGADVLASGRSTDELLRMQSATNGQITPLTLDVVNPSDWAHAQASLAEGIDVLVYSAGSWAPIDFLAWDHAVFEDQMQVNFLGLVRAVSVVLHGMIERDSGMIVGLSSASAYMPLPRAEAYGASKAAVLYFLESLRIDLRRTRVRVISVTPGFVDTPLTQGNDFAMPFMTSAGAAVEAIVGGIERGKDEIHFPKRLTLPLKLISSMPRSVGEWLIGTALKRS